MSAFLKNEEDPMEPLITIFRYSLNIEEENLLRRIETVVYEHPQLLDDFSTEIIINTERAVWIPRRTVGNHQENQESYDKDEG